MVFVTGGGPGSARPLSSTPFWPKSREIRTSASGAASVSSSLVRPSLTCRCSRPSAGSRAGAEGRALVSLLRRQAPTWLVQIPAFVEEAERDLLIRRGHGATPERMARELSEALKALCAESPLLLWLEDLHWSNPPTVDLLAMLARRRAAARLLVVGTYRSAM